MDLVDDLLIRKDKFKISGLSINHGLYKISKKDSHGISNIPLLHVEYSEDTSNDVSITPINEHNSNYKLILPRRCHYLTDGDIVEISRNTMRIVLSNNADTNTLLVTENCNNICSFCSQPPKVHDDTHLYNMATLALIEFETDKVIGITGGEPTLNRKKFLDLFRQASLFEQKKSFHVLTNGRAFKDLSFINELSIETRKHDVVFGIPLYSITPSIHDDMVGSKGAWQETIDGLINAIHAGLRIELRFIPTQTNHNEIGNYLTFTSTFLAGIEQLSIMNLEPQGWAKANWERLFISPNRYLSSMESEFKLAQKKGLQIRLFNFSLCSIESTYLRDYSVKSISDWKNYFPKECTDCTKLDDCCGYFSSAKNSFKIEPRPIR